MRSTLVTIACLSLFAGCSSGHGSGTTASRSDAAPSDDGATGGTSPGGSTGSVAVGGTTASTDGGSPSGGSSGGQESTSTRSSAGGTSGSGGISGGEAGGSKTSLGGTGAGGSPGSGGKSTKNSSSNGGTSSSGGTTVAGGSSGESTGGAGSSGGSTGVDGGSGSDDQPIGWASVEGLGLSATSGGLGGPETTVTTCADLKSAVKKSGAAIIKVSGSITCDDVVASSDKSIIGLPGAAIISPPDSTNHLLVFKKVSNIIVRNLKLQGAGVSAGAKSGGDVFHIETNVHHLWADHLDISDGDDGNLDITHDCDYITVSWVKFHYTTKAREHRFCDLISSALGDTGTYKITFHHNWWADNIDQRSPRAHEGNNIHIFNNYYSETGNLYCVGVGQNAVFLSENNYFDGVDTPFEMSPNSEVGGQILSKGDVFHNTTGNKTDTGKGFTPPYAYKLDPAANVPSAIQAGAGPTLK